MVSIKDMVEAELENIEKVISEFPESKNLPYLSMLELAGVATLLHNYYNGIENIFKQILKHDNITLPSGGSWHKDLLNLAENNEIISSETKQRLIGYLAFRHFFSHAYALDLYSTKMEPLVESLKVCYSAFKHDLSKKLQ